MVARAIKRRGDDPTNWCVADADAAHVIDDLFVRLQDRSHRISIPSSPNATISWPKSRL
jgi:hypothetical protein